MNPGRPSRGHLYSWVVVFAALLALNFVVGVESFRSDALAYWYLSAPGNVFSMHEVLRGYAFPAILMPFSWLDGLIGSTYHLPFRLLSSAAYSLILTGPLADGMARLLRGETSPTRRVAFALIIIAIFPGLFVYPLSDLPAVCLLIGALSAATSRKAGWATFFFAGLLSYLAYNTRTIYIFAIPAIVVSIIVFARKEKRTLQSVIIFIAGLAAAALPQVARNYANHGQASPFVSATIHGRSLMVSQLFWGLSTQKYETGTTPDGSKSVPISYLDAAGGALEAQFDPDGTAGFSDYGRLLASHPGTMSGIYARHVVNGMDVRDGLAYKPDISPGSRVASIFCFVIVFLGVIAFFARPITFTEFVLATCLLLPVAAIIPGAIETRFFLPLFVLASALVAFRLDMRELLQLGRARLSVLGIAFGLGLAGFLYITTITTASVAYTNAIQRYEARATSKP